MLSVYFAPSQINVQKCMDNSSHLLLMLIWSLCSLSTDSPIFFFFLHQNSACVGKNRSSSPAVRTFGIKRGVVTGVFYVRVITSVIAELYKCPI